MEEAYTEPLGSKDGTLLLKVKKKKGGFKTKASATGFELLQIAAMLIDTVSTESNVPHAEALGAVTELLQGELNV